ncbi:hypothetical protein [Stieleria varia]|uniref:Uncharacterized protein n=1 Tax=Stieleria varia TaxID=2528005 RepID=A0A5C6A3U1_9BACT|nr:hypothetical protein [Stieleria varia]TWT94564.1 hypothetical protein Pla52n_53850 [Stieleria varia]
MMHSFIQFGKWFLMLVIGFFLIGFLLTPMTTVGAGIGTGYFSYYFSASFQVWPKEENDTLGSLDIEGNVGPQFLLWGHSCPAYKSVELQWEMFHAPDQKGRASIDLERMAFDDGERVSHLNETSLSELIGFSDTNPRDKERVATLMQLLISARDATLPPPRHHGIPLPEPLSGSMQHHAAGICIPPFALLWLILWNAYGLWKSPGRKRLNDVNPIEENR